MGSNPCSVGEHKLAQQEFTILHPEQTFNFVHSKYPHCIHFTGLNKANPISPKVSEIDEVKPKPKKARFDELSDSDNEAVVPPKKADTIAMEPKMKRVRCDEMSDSDDEAVDPPKKADTTAMEPKMKRVRCDEMSDSDDDPVDNDLEEMRETLKGKMSEEVKKLMAVRSQDESPRESTASSDCAQDTWQELPDELLVYTSKGVVPRSKVR